MTIWKADEWKPHFAWFPTLVSEGGFVWGRCERRRLQNRYEDGYDHLRRIDTQYQYRRSPTPSEG